MTNTNNKTYNPFQSFHHFARLYIQAKEKKGNTNGEEKEKKD